MARHATQIDDATLDRERMVDRQIAARGVTDWRVLEAMRQVPREAFVEAGLEEFAYEDSPLPIAQGQTISQPILNDGLQHVLGKGARPLARRRRALPPLQAQ